MGDEQKAEGVPEEHEHGHQGSFATGQEVTEHHPEREEEENGGYQSKLGHRLRALEAPFHPPWIRTCQLAASPKLPPRGVGTAAVSGP